MSTPADPRQRLLDLLADQALQGLDSADEAELELLLHAFPDVDAEELQRTAAALDRALAEPAPEPLPAQLRLTVERDLVRLMNAGAKGHPVGLRLTAAPPDQSGTIRGRRRWLRPVLAWSGWAAALLIAVGAWWLFRPGPKSTPAQELARLRQTPGTKNVAVEVGEVIWNNERQEGYLRLTGVPANDPNREQYQIWLVDAERELHPVDGGVFDVSGNGEVIVPIRARLPVRKPLAVAVTREKPGGVVVSKQQPEQIVLVANLGS
jgi:anti-sigma-K factor RskA